jgi:hypothetical protein
MKENLRFSNYEFRFEKAHMGLPESVLLTLALGVSVRY